MFVCTTIVRTHHKMALKYNFKDTYFANRFTSALDFIPPLGDNRIFKHSNSFNGSIRGCEIFIMIIHSMFSTLKIVFYVLLISITDVDFI